MGQRKGALEKVVINREFWRRRRVLVTGHTGFKGGWLSLWLHTSGAEVGGYALAPPTQPSFFDLLKIDELIQSRIGDVRNYEALAQAFAEFKPELVFHLAAQSLVRAAYADPLGTYATNVMGTANVLQAVRACGGVRAVVVVTSDKCYENREWARGYREDDAMGGYDPYSSSKGCAELVTAAFRTSFFNPDRHGEHGVAVASARGGNVIGGGDWARDRLIPDLVRGAEQGAATPIRNPAAVRPWQHVLDPLQGYMTLAEKLVEEGSAYSSGWNFGPREEDAAPVAQVADTFCHALGHGARWMLDRADHPHEAQQLRLDSSKARQSLRWRPQLPLREALQWTAEWYAGWLSRSDLRKISLTQLETYQSMSSEQER